MQRFRVTHTLRYELDGSVAKATLTARLRPRSLPGQEVERFRLDVVPAPTVRSSTEDGHGNGVESIEVTGPIRSLELVAESLVSLDTAARRESLLALRAAAPPFRRAGRPSAKTPRAHPLSSAVRVESHGPVLWEAGVVEAGGGRPVEDADAFVGEMAERASHGMMDMPSLIEAVVTCASRALVYDAREAQPGRPLSDALARGRGVCQDYANLAIAALRALGVEARYVAGYVPVASGRDAGGPERGSSLHAWIAVPVQGHGWVHADPTTGSIGCERYIACALGRGYWETAPIAGALDGAARVARTARVVIEETGVGLQRP